VKIWRVQVNGNMGFRYDVVADSAFLAAGVAQDLHTRAKHPGPPTAYRWEQSISLEVDQVATVVGPIAQSTILG
jgi:hypothetical protein